MKKPARNPSFRVTGTQKMVAGPVALATITVVGATSIYTGALCPPPCNWKVMSIPGNVLVSVRRISHDSERSGQGRTCNCHKCGKLVEVREYPRG